MKYELVRVNLSRTIDLSTLDRRVMNDFEKLGALTFLSKLLTARSKHKIVYDIEDMLRSDVHTNGDILVMNGGGMIIHELENDSDDIGDLVLDHLYMLKDDLNLYALCFPFERLRKINNPMIMKCTIREGK